MGSYCTVLARRRGLALWDDDEICLAAMLHDVGKVAVPDAVLLKPGPLSEDEYEIVKRHCQTGYTILSEGGSRIVVLGARIALSHHERWDATGYPAGLAGENIPLEGRIAAIADVFDALTSARVYKPAMSFDQAADVLRSERERHFDPLLVDLFLEDLDEIAAIRAANPDVVAVAVGTQMGG
jgi:response regulator RpfG family c-di-GMP phosphodiesterase